MPGGGRDSRPVPSDLGPREPLRPMGRDAPTTHYAARGFEDAEWREEELDDRDYDEVCFMASLPAAEEVDADL